MLIMIKGVIQQANITLIKIYAPYVGAPKYVKQILMDIKKETDSNTVKQTSLKHHWQQWTNLPDRN